MSANPYLTFSAVARELRVKHSLKLKNYGLTQHLAQTCVSQSTSELKRFADRHHLKYHITEFEPSGKWAFINLHRLKFKWLHTPQQTIINNKVYSALTASKIDKHIYAVEFKSTTAQCVAYFHTESDINKVAIGTKNIKLLVPHTVQLRVNNLIFPEEVTLGSYVLEQVFGFDYIEATIDRHGIYINCPSRNKTEISEDIFSSSTSVILEPNKFAVSIESRTAKDYLFKIDC